jgi:hypothetical protein
VTAQQEERQKYTTPPPRLCRNEGCLWKEKYAEESQARERAEERATELEGHLKKLRLQLLKKTKPVDRTDSEAVALERFIEQRDASRAEVASIEERSVIATVAARGRRRRDGED